MDSGKPDRPGSKYADGQATSEGPRLKDPKVTTSSQHVMFGQTAEGHPTMTRTTYTRMEATLQDRSQGSQASAGARDRTARWVQPPRPVGNPHLAV